jgi:glycosyltransferase involved in cell wall biosynthesis
MARYLGCDNARFHGHVDDVTAIWNSHHALVLPSRAEGLPLVLVEAMLAGRVTVVSKAGGIAEVVDDGVTGFLMAGQDEDGLDAAMERAWQARANWKVIGAAAALSIRQQVPADPPSELAQEILALAQKVMGKSDL